MTYNDFNEICQSLPATSYVIQWGGSHVWKVGGKVFAIGGWSDQDEAAVTFKVSEQDFHFLDEQAGFRPAPYLAARGMTWIQQYKIGGDQIDQLRFYLTESHKIVSAGLSKKKQRELGLVK